MRYTRYVLAGLLVIAPALGAQRIQAFGPEFRTLVGAYVPTGAQQDDFKSATMLGAQAAFELNDNFHVLGSLGWVHGHNKFNFGSTDNTYIWQYDVGAELNALYVLANHWTFRPFVGLGGGARTYDYRATQLENKTCTAGYGALGTELQHRFVALRLEARDYLTCYESPLTGKKNTRNDLGISAGFAFHIR
jgi:hypothetical protein